MGMRTWDSILGGTAVKREAGSVMFFSKFLKSEFN